MSTHGHYLLDRMGAGTRRQLHDDVEAHGAEALDLPRGRRSAQVSQRAVLERWPDLGARRAERLAAWLTRYGPRSPLGADDPAPAPTPVPDAAGEKLTVKDDADALSREVAVERSQQIKTLEGLLEASETDLEAWRVASHVVNKWPQASVDRRTGEVVVTELWQVKATLERRLLAEVQPVRRLPVRHRKPSPARGGLRCWVFLPDTQHGYRWSRDLTQLEPMHDPRAIDAAIQLCGLLQPEGVTWLGDNLDAAELSEKFPREPSLRQTLQPSLAALHYDYTRAREACPDATMEWLEGNHGERLRRLMTSRVPELVDVAPVGEDRPAMGLDRLLRLDDLGIRYVAPYGAETWVWEQIRAHHGEVVRKGGGSTVATVIKTAPHSEVFGHVHRREIAFRQVHGPAGPRTIFAMSPGCLCRIDGAVPAATPRVDWHQGVGVVWYDEEADALHPQVIPIEDGRIVWQGQVIEGEDRSDEVAAATGYPQIARAA